MTAPNASVCGDVSEAKVGWRHARETVGLSEFVHVFVRIARSNIEALAHLTDFTVVEEHSKSTSCSLVIVNC